MSELARATQVIFLYDDGYLFAYETASAIVSSLGWPDSWPSLVDSELYNVHGQLLRVELKITPDRGWFARWLRRETHEYLFVVNADRDAGQALQDYMRVYLSNQTMNQADMDAVHQLDMPGLVQKFLQDVGFDKCASTLSKNPEWQDDEDEDDSEVGLGSL